MTGTSGNTRWCNKHFALKNFDVIGQTGEEYFNVLCLYDEHIRNTCLHHQYHFKNLFLISDDINLGNKALVSNVDTLASEKLPEIVIKRSIPQDNMTIDVPFKKSCKTQRGCMPGSLFDRIRFSLTSTITDISQHHMKIYGNK